MPTGLTFAAAASRALRCRPRASVALTANSINSSDLTNYTFSSQAIGVAAANRIVCCVAHTLDTADNSVSTATIGGVSATIAQNYRANNGAVWNLVSIFYAVVPTGTTADVVVNLSASAYRLYCGVFAVHGATYSTHLDSGNASGDPAAITGLDVPDGGVVIAGATLLDTPTGATYTWTNVTESYDADGEGANEQYSAGCAAFPFGATGLTVTADPSASNINAAAAVVFR